MCAHGHIYDFIIFYCVLLFAALNVEAPPATAHAADAIGTEPDEAENAPVMDDPENAPVEAAVEMDVDDQEEEDDEDDAPSSSDDDEESEEEAPRQRFFCCMDDQKAGGWWYCPGGCSHCFHHACKAEHPDLRDGQNKVCVPCHVAAKSRGRGARGAAKAANQRTA